MTPSEFKAWLDGFSEAIDGRPTAAQWARIQEQVKRLTAGPSINMDGLYRKSLGSIVAAPALPFHPLPAPLLRYATSATSISACAGSPYPLGDGPSTH